VCLGSRLSQVCRGSIGRMAGAVGVGGRRRSSGLGEGMVVLVLCAGAAGGEWREQVVWKRSEAKRGSVEWGATIFLLGCGAAKGEWRWQQVSVE
jgi:hypothetical protein